MNVDRLFSVKDKVVLVTGGSRGIGLGIAMGYVGAGAKVYISSRSADVCENVAKELTKKGPGKCIAIPANLQEISECKRLIEEVGKHEGHLDVLVNNAGANWAAPIESYPMDAWTKVMNLNLVRIFTLTQAALPLLTAKATAENPSSVINIGSIDGFRTSSLFTFAYGASKAGLHHLTRHLAAHLGDKHVLVNAIAPGTFQSKMMKATLEKFGESIKANIPVGRIGTAEDIAGTCIYLSSRAGQYTNGAVIVCDGGRLINAKLSTGAVSHCENVHHETPQIPTPVPYSVSCTQMPITEPPSTEAHNITYTAYPYMPDETKAVMEERQRFLEQTATALNQASDASSTYTATISDDNLHSSSGAEQYPAWSDAKQPPIKRDEFYTILLDLRYKFGFQHDNVCNIDDYILTLLDSRASRMTPDMALLTLHADVIGGENANYRKWYFATQFNLDEAFGDRNNDVLRLSTSRRQRQPSNRVKLEDSTPNRSKARSLENAETRWKQRMMVLTPTMMIQQIGLYLLIWGETAPIRFTPECLCFLFKTCWDYYESEAGKEEMVPIAEGIFLMDIIQPLYDFIRDQTYELVDGKYVRREKDHANTIGEREWQWSVVGLGGAIATLFMIVGTFTEFFFVTSSNATTTVLFRRLLLLIIILIANITPTVYIVLFNRSSNLSWFLGIAQFGFGLFCTLVFALVPPSRLFLYERSNARRSIASQTFTANFPKLTGVSRLMSIGFWFCILGCKFVESYFFLALSFKDPLAVMAHMRIDNCGDSLFGSTLCRNMPIWTLVLMFSMALVLFFLDTYLWYIIWNTIFSVVRAFYLGISVWLPWRNVFAMLPKLMFSNLILETDSEIRYKPKVLCSQIWNAVVISMYREHLLTIDHVQQLLYRQTTSPDDERILQPPSLFTPSSGRMERRISFFSQSLSTTKPKPLPVDSMPTFTVFTPHYSEKVLLSLREIIREEDQHTKVTLIEYLKQLHKGDWENFVSDTKMLAKESHLFSDNSQFSIAELAEKQDAKSGKNGNVDDLAFNYIGFKSSTPEYTMRTRIWASLRAQTLYRTVSGFMNYQKALKLLHRVENPDLVHAFASLPERLESDLDQVANRKFKFVVSMQRYNKFSKEEVENADFLLQTYRDLQIAYIEEEPSRDSHQPATVYSVLIDGHCERMANGYRKPKYRVRLPGNPILGDGKSDNQNHAIIFSRGEYLQLVDANQDNYLEECLKIRNILGEFEEYESPSNSPYSLAHDTQDKDPVAIVGAREYIFSENIGVLGDVAAGKEQTFGTLSQRNLAKIGGKLHYGHPDFLNVIFMITRGGVSKAQKGLHLNEDIYAGMNAFIRGGRIKHTEYYQCGKGRDLGFGSILNFITKIGTGMGEQMLSREYYYIGTQLPLDRFLTFYYAHPGFHINNIFIILSVQLFMFVMLFLGALMSTVPVCPFSINITQELPSGCYNLLPVFEWITRCVLSIIIVFFVAFLPLFLQELTEKGIIRSVARLGKHFLSLSPMFEVFVTQIYTNSILTNLSFGGARYIATGRGFATS
ncbi:1,3-beta-glucan synthase component FKS1 [Bifiguratus adelaidae]|uniref:1,3-beta-glucan synthase n=1 Tax=Bifiguratus adelaidae TaxID=1938954 RepID=A0A261XVJ9_9FUNG|nr:1,3-beta-glucan synthase component FKS1 [Bifiguratus adelaidae]